MPQRQNFCYRICFFVIKKIQKMKYRKLVHQTLLSNKSPPFALSKFRFFVQRQDCHCRIWLAILWRSPNNCCKNLETVTRSELLQISQRLSNANIDANCGFISLMHKIAIYRLLTYNLQQVVSFSMFDCLLVWKKVWNFEKCFVSNFKAKQECCSNVNTCL